MLHEREGKLSSGALCYLAKPTRAANEFNGAVSRELRATLTGPPAYQNSDPNMGIRP